MLITAYFIQGFNRPKCEHVFTTIERDTVRVSQSWYGGGIFISNCIFGNKHGLHAGEKELVCVKCFIVQRQVLDYGPPCQPCQNEKLPSDTLSFITGFPHQRYLIVRGDSLFNDTLTYYK